MVSITASVTVTVHVDPALPVHVTEIAVTFPLTLAWRMLAFGIDPPLISLVPLIEPALPFVEDGPEPLPDKEGWDALAEAVNAFPEKSTAAQNDADEHDTDISSPLLSMLVDGLQELPLKTTAFPSWSTATQNDADGHDTDTSPSSPSIMVGGLQELPL
jgi:hypothetical protein